MLLSVPRATVHNVERTSIRIGITLDRRPESFETLVASAGAYALVLSSVLSGSAIELHSSYLGHPGASTCNAFRITSQNLDTPS